MKELYKSLAAVQADLKAPKSNRNTFGNYNYRSAEDILEAVKPLLKENGLTMILSDKIVHEQSQHKPEQITYKNSKGYDVQDVIGGDRFYVESTVTIFDGEGDSVTATGVARESQFKAGMDDSQITGAASSYARKYALNGMFNIDDTKDADTDEHTEQRNKDTAPEVIRNRAEESAEGPSPMGVDVVAEVKARKEVLNEDMIKLLDLTRPDQRLAFVKRVLEKETIDTLQDTDLVSDAIDNERIG